MSSCASRWNTLLDRCMGNVPEITVDMFLALHINPLFIGGERSVCVLRAHSLLLHQRGDDPGPLSECKLSFSQTSVEGGLIVDHSTSPLYTRRLEATNSCTHESIRFSSQDLLFSACGLSILSTIICTLSTVTCSIHIFSLDLVHLVSADTARFSPLHMMSTQQ